MGGSLWGGSWRFDWIIRFEEGAGYIYIILWCDACYALFGNGWMDGRGIIDSFDTATL